MKCMLLLAFISGVLFCRIVIYLTAIKFAKEHGVSTEELSKNGASAVFKFWSADFASHLFG